MIHDKYDMKIYDKKFYTINNCQKEKLKTEDIDKHTLLACAFLLLQYDINKKVNLVYFIITK